MTGYEISDLLASNRELISATWNYFLSVHLALFGVIFIVSGRARRFERVVLIAAYVGFMFLNYAAQIENYDIYCRIVDQIASMPNDAIGGAQAKALVPLGQPWVMDWLAPIYASAAGSSAIIIMLINRRKLDG
ncbi:MAG: hypothetical protein AAF720_02235 [Pseudomonadota bacterium]